MILMMQSLTTIKKPKQNNKRIKQFVQTNRIYTTNDLVDEDVRKAEAKRQKELAVYLAKEERNNKKGMAIIKKEALLWVSKRLTCKGKHEQGERQPKWKDENSWNWCETCNYFGLCDVCSLNQMELINEHEFVCDDVKERFGEFLVVEGA